MVRRQHHEEHTNHEAWAIPYGDLITLLLALFVVMYAVSSVNEGKFRVLSEALSEAFGGPPRSVAPIQVGEHISKGADHDQHMSVLPTPAFDQNIGMIMQNAHRSLPAPRKIVEMPKTGFADSDQGPHASEFAQRELGHMVDEVQNAMADLIQKNLVVVRRRPGWIEIEIRTDILFPSGVSAISGGALPVLDRLAGILKPYPNVIRIEGHTDNVPINTTAFSSNWELSAARAASVVRQFIQQGVDPTRMSVAGFAEYKPVADNSTPEGRNRNRRVVLVVLADADDHRALALDKKVSSP